VSAKPFTIAWLDPAIDLKRLVDDWIDARVKCRHDEGRG
jgi:hypothetical protein